MNFYEKEAAEEQKNRIIIEQNLLCAFCKEPLSHPIEIAHRIPKHKKYLKKYGKNIIHHRLNLAATHPGRCNSRMLIDPATHPIEASALIDDIKQDLKYND